MRGRTKGGEMRITTIAWMLGVVSAAGTAAASAQPIATPASTFSVGYQYTHVPDLGFPLGVSVAATFPLGTLSGVGEVTWARKTETDTSLPSVTISQSGTILTFGGGVRWS